MQLLFITNKSRIIFDFIQSFNVHIKIDIWVMLLANYLIYIVHLFVIVIVFFFANTFITEKGDSLNCILSCHALRT